MYEYTFQIVKNICIPKPDNFNSQIFNGFLPIYIFLLLIMIKMILTIQFDCQSQTRTVKIHRIAVNAVLPAEFKSFKFFTLKLLP